MTMVRRRWGRWATSQAGDPDATHDLFAAAYEMGLDVTVAYRVRDVTQEDAVRLGDIVGARRNVEITWIGDDDIGALGRAEIVEV